MSEKLLETKFLTVNVQSLFNNNENSIEAEVENTNEDSDTNDAETAQETSENTEQDYPANFDWGEELKNRLKANKEMSAEARFSNYEIETKFFKDFFTANWPDPDCVKQLILMGDPLKKMLKVLGFDKKLNPVLAFLSRPYVQKELLKTKLLNVNTFKAIYNAVAKKLVADSQFLIENNYNIIYCKDLYKKSAKEMLEYLELQKQILKPSANAYTKADLLKNRRVFLHVDLDTQDPNKYTQKIKMLADNEVPRVDMPDATLNEYKLAETVKDNLGVVGGGRGGMVHLNSDAMQKLADALDTQSKILAMLMSLSTSTNNAEAKKAIANKDKFSGVTKEKLIDATREIAELVPKGRLSDKDAKALVSILLSKL